MASTTGKCERAGAAVLVLLALVVTGCSAAAPVPEARRDDPLEDGVRRLSRATKWRQLEARPLEFDAFHPQGMMRDGDSFLVSSVELLEPPRRLEKPVDGFDRTPGAGVGHLLRISREGRLLADVKLGEGDIYHPGGITWRGASVLVPVAQYRPASRSIVYEVDPVAGQVKELFRVADHLGALVWDPMANELFGITWGSREVYRFDAQGRPLAVVKNPQHFIDYQHAQYVGSGKAICGGIAEMDLSGQGRVALGGLALVELRTAAVLHAAPILARSPQGHPINRNPFHLERADGKLRMWTLPDDGKATLLLHEAE